MSVTRTLFAFAAVVALAAAALTDEEKTELDTLIGKIGKSSDLSSSTNKALVDSAEELDNKLNPSMKTDNGALLTRIRNGQDATFKRLGVYSTTEDELNKRVKALADAFDPANLETLLGNALDDAMEGSAAIQGIKTDLKSFSDSLASTYIPIANADDFDKDIKEIRQMLTQKKGEMEAATKKNGEDAIAATKKLETEVTKLVDDSLKKTKDAIAKSEKEVKDSVAKTMSGSEAVLKELKTTYWSNPQIPVYRWKIWDTHHHGVSWFDENRNQGFGGVHPSHWTDGNRRAHDLANNWAYLNRLFNDHAVASSYGATICAITYMMFSSTNGKMCGAVFRIRNTGTSSIAWRPPMTMTSFSGWSERASISVNGGNNYDNGGCHNECHFTPTLTMAANSDKNRINTVIFISSSSRAYGGWYSIHERAVVLMIRDNGLKLPSGLEYVDDFASLSGAWKK